MTKTISTTLAALLLACACGNSNDSDTETESAEETRPEEPAPPTFEEKRFAEADGVTVDPRAAERLPSDTAGALTIADLHRLIDKLGLTHDAQAVLEALREELAGLLGLDLLDPEAATTAGLKPSEPVTLAWLDPEGSELALVVAVEDAAKLESALGERPVLVKGDRALIPLGASADAAKKKLTAVDPRESLQSSGKLSGFGSVRFGEDAALYLDAGQHGVTPGAPVTAGLTVQTGGIHAKLAVRTDRDAPIPTAFASSAARVLGVPGIDAEPPYAHQLLRELERSGAGTVVRIPVALVAQKLLGYRGASIGKKLGYLAMAARVDGSTIVYFGGVAFDGALAEDVAASAAALGRDRARRANSFRVAKNAGILARLDSQEGAFASLTGTADFSSGLDDENVYGGLLGNEVGDMQGGFGFGARDGGAGWGTIGTGRYGTIGGPSGGGTGSGYGTGSGRGGLGGKTKTPQVRIGAAKARGDLDKNVIRRYIRRKLPRIKYCYEKQLLLDEDLAGKATVHFTISESGEVAAAETKGPLGAKVNGCISTAVKQIQFPRPKGGVVVVSYPFVFKNGS